MRVGLDLDAAGEHGRSLRLVVLVGPVQGAARLGIERRHGTRERPDIDKRRPDQVTVQLVEDEIYRGVT
jgi:hypothetical protein